MENIITMTTKEAKRYEVIQRLINQEIDGTQAAKQLKLSVRQTKRIKAKVLKAKKQGKQGIEGVIHGNRGRESNNKIDEEIKEETVNIIKELYPDFTSQLTYEKLQEEHDSKLSYSSVRRIRIEEGLSVVKPQKSNKKYFSQRERKEYFGEMIQYDGSYHDWFEGRCTDEGMEQEQCLLLAIDDATGEPTAKLAKNESVNETFKFWRDYVKQRGKPVFIYIDQFSTYKVNHKNAVDNKEFKTQFQRAMEDELDIEVISAHTPQAKGRVERMNGTWQDRLIKEMRLAKISNIKDANEFIKKEFIPKFSKKFNVKAKKKGDLHRKLDKKEKANLNHIFSIKHTRKVRNDFVIQYKNRYFQLAQTQKNATVYKKDEVIVEEHLDGTIYLCKKTNQGDKYLDFKELPSKPEKEMNVKLPAITRNRTSYTPPANHPWRMYEITNNIKVKN